MEEEGWWPALGVGLATSPWKVGAQTQPMGTGVLCCLLCACSDEVWALQARYCI